MGLRKGREGKAKGGGMGGVSIDEWRARLDDSVELLRTDHPPYYGATYA